MFWLRLSTVLMLMGVTTAMITAAKTTAAENLRWLPDTVNGLAMVHVAEIYASPLAQREGWAKTAAQAFVNQKAIVPPGTESLVFGCEFGLSPQLPALKEYAVVTLGRPTALATLSELGAGEIEVIEGKPTLTLSNGGFLVAESEKLWRFTAPAGRQAGIKWLRQKPAEEVRFSPFLQDAVTSKDKTAHVLVLLDLTDAITPSLIRPAINTLPSVEKLNAVARDRVIDTLASVRGLSLKVNVYEDLQAELRFSFEQPPQSLASLAQPLLGDLLSYMGASLESADQWTSAIFQDSLVFRGSITAAEVRRILSLFRGQDLADAGTATEEPTQAEPTPAEIAKASQKYYGEIKQILDDLRGTLRKTRDNHAMWFERYGRKIDGLRMLNVDPDLLTYGQKVSNSLRYQGQALRVANVRTGSRVASSGANNYYRSTSAYVGPYGGSYWATATGSPADGNAIRVEEHASAKGIQFSEWKQIEDGLVDIRRTLTERYRVEF